MALYTTVEKVKEYMLIKDEDGEDTALIERLIAACSRWIEDWTHRKFDLQTYTDTFSGNNSYYHVFQNYPCVEVESVSVNGFLDFKFLDFQDNQVFVPQSFPRGNRNCKVTYKAGFATTPADIEQACIILVGIEYKNRDHLEQTSKAIQGETTSFISKDMPDRVKNILWTHRKIF